MAEIPCGFVANTERALDLKRAHSFLGLAHEIYCGKPFPEREMAIVEDCPRCYAELVAS
jgi:hypothetical protein